MQITSYEKKAESVLSVRPHCHHVSFEHKKTVCDAVSMYGMYTNYGMSKRLLCNSINISVLNQTPFIFLNEKK